MRIALGVEYDGTNYHGWQKQHNVDSIQGQIELALSKVASHSISVIAAGRTDAGVHAIEQVMHFDTNVQRPHNAWVAGVNSYLPNDIKVLWVKYVDNSFHARYNAIARKYRYLIYNYPIASALFRNRAMWYKLSLNEKLMYNAGQLLIGEHDFSSFRASGCQSKSAIRRMISIDINRTNNIINIDIKANAFLLHMVRNIIGVLIKIGNREHNIHWVHDILVSKNRNHSGITAKAHGLYLLKISYPNL